VPWVYHHQLSSFTQTFLPCFLSRRNRDSWHNTWSIVVYRPIHIPHCPLTRLLCNPTAVKYVRRVWGGLRKGYPILFGYWPQVDRGYLSVYKLSRDIVLCAILLGWCCVSNVLILTSSFATQHMLTCVAEFLAAADRFTLQHCLSPVLLSHSIIFPISQ
jgi:hypothetical protein